MIVHLHCFSSNDAALLRHFFKRHQAWVDQFHVWDLQSTDATLAWLTERADVKVHGYLPEGDSLINTQRMRFDQAWKQSTGKADWVVMLHADEHLHHPDLLGYLESRARDGVTAIRSIGYEMVGDKAPAELDGRRLLCEQLTQGFRSPGLDRLVIFSPSALTATNFAPGQHHAWPEGHVVWPASPEVLLLRFQMLGEEHFVSTCRARASALLPEDRKHGWASHLDWSDEELIAHMAELRSQSKTVPGLGELSDIEPQDYRRDERLVETSGLFDAEEYEARYPDIVDSQIDALTHYCEYGWREGRQPNPYFDGEWYAKWCGAELPEDRDPFLHYIETGERENLQPSEHFDPQWYREIYGLDEQVSPLRHYLEHRSSGMVSPLPTFDVDAYVAAHPQLLEQQKDPYLHHLAAQEDAAAPPPPGHHAPLPQWEQLLALLDPSDADDEAARTVAMPLVEAAVRTFLPWLPFDAEWYLRANPDVAEAVAEGALESAHAHFIDNGFFEGRAPIPERDA